MPYAHPTPDEERDRLTADLRLAYTHLLRANNVIDVYGGGDDDLSHVIYKMETCQWDLEKMLGIDSEDDPDDWR